MATSRDTIDFILQRLRSPRFGAKPMFGEYTLYADGKAVALVCDDRLYVKVVPASASLAETCEFGSPYPGAKEHYMVDEGQLASMTELPRILLDISAGLPAAKPKKPSRARS